MKKYIPILTLIGLCLLFFYKTILSGSVPFPGDLLLSQYAPWRHVSYSGYVAGSVPSKDQYFDVIRELYPWKTQVVDQIKHKTAPLWNPYNFSGAPLLANYQSQVFYPLTVVYFLLPQLAAWTVMVILQPVLGAVFMYLFATEIGLTAAAAMLAALLFNFSSFASVWMEFTTVWHTILWLPLLLYIVERAAKQGRLSLGQQLLFIFGLFNAITAGHPQDFINSFLFLLIYIVGRIATMPDWPWKKRAVFLGYPMGFVLIMPFLLASPQLLPTIELFGNSARVSHDYQGIIQTMLVQWWQMPLLMVQDLFGNPATKSNFSGDYIGKTLSVGVTGFIFVLAALTQTSRSWHKKFFAGAAIIILLLTVRTPLTELLYRYPLPILSTGTPTRILFVLMLAMSVLAGIGFDAIWRNKKPAYRGLCVSWILLGLLWAFALLHPAISGLSYPVNALSTMKRALLVATSLLGIVTVVLGTYRFKRIILWAIIPIAAAELLYGFLKFNPFVPPTFVYPENKLITYLKTNAGIYRSWGYGTAGIEANFATQEYMYSTDGTDPLNLKWYNQFLQSSNEGDIAVTFNRRTRSDTQLAPGYGERDLPSNKFRLRLMDILGVKFIVNRAENPVDSQTFPAARFKEVWRQEDWTVYENLSVAPRFFLTADVRPYENAADFKRQLFADDFQPGKTVLVESGDYKTLPRLSGGAYTINLVAYAPDRATFSITSETRQLLFVSDTFDNGWKATVNGQLVPVYRADWALRALIVPEGNSTVTLIYRPQSFQTGVAISIVTLIFLAAYSAIRYYRRAQ